MRVVRLQNEVEGARLTECCPLCVCVCVRAVIQRGVIRQPVAVVCLQRLLT